MISSAVPIGEKTLKEKYIGERVHLATLLGDSHDGKLMVDPDTSMLFVRETSTRDGNSELEVFSGDFALRSGDNISLPTPRWPDSSRTYNVSLDCSPL